MGIFLTLLALIFIIGLILAAAMHPEKSALSLAELKRRSEHSQADLLELDRYELYPALVTILRSIRALLLVLATFCLIGAFGWLVGAVLTLILAVVHPAIARIKPITKVAGGLYERIEGPLLDFSARFERAFHVLREPGISVHEKPHRVHSREELSELIEHSTEVVGEKERALLKSALAFPEKLVSSSMTPKSVIDFIKKSEFLGPLVLDELHALGHSRLPVIDEDLDHVVGVLHLRDLLSLDVKRSVTAEKAMEAKVYYIREDDTLEHALSAFIRTRHHLFVVINKNRETVGLLTLEDVIEQLIGRKIIDEDDIHADLRAVAEREGKSLNASEGSVTV